MLMRIFKTLFINCPHILPYCSIASLSFLTALTYCLPYSIQLVFCYTAALYM